MDAPSYQQLLLENQQLLLENQQLRQQLAERDRTIAHLQNTIGELQKRLGELERAVKRQAAPFSKGLPVAKPKKPGRKSGREHGRHGHRPPPTPDQIDETHEAPLPCQCPDCGGNVVEDRLDEQYQTEIPRKPIVRKFKIHCGHCDQCGKHLRGRHELQTSDATGAAQSQLGSDAQAAIVYLNKHAGLSHGKIADAFDKVFGISVSRGACAQIVLRSAKKLQPVFEQIKERVRNSEYLTPDETGWRVGGHPVWLHGWVGDDGATLYAIDPQRSADVLEKVIGIEWSGNMTHDGFSSYDRFENAIHQQCVDHALRRARALADKQIGAAKAFPGQVIDLLEEALEVRDRFNTGELGEDRRESKYEEYVERMRKLTGRPRTNAANETFAKHLHKHDSEWFAFMLDRDIPATNHRAEQALRTPIVNRKVWGGNRTSAGAKAQEVTSSVLQTCKNRKLDPFAFISRTLRGICQRIFG